MKRLLLLLLIVLLGLMAVVVGRTLLLPAAAFNSAPVSLPEGLDGQRAAESLAAAIRLHFIVDCPIPLVCAQNLAPQFWQNHCRMDFVVLDSIHHRLWRG